MTGKRNEIGDPAEQFFFVQIFWVCFAFSFYYKGLTCS